MIQAYKIILTIDLIKSKMLENHYMNCNKNEQYLLKFISKDVSENDDEMLSFLLNNGIKLKLQNTNSVYQIIDELNFSDYINKVG